MTHVSHSSHLVASGFLRRRGTGVAVVSLWPSEMRLVAQEATQALSRAVVQGVFAPTTTRVYLELRIPGRTATLLVTSDPQVARLSAVTHRPANPPRPPGWQSVLRRELVGARLRDVEALPERKTLLLHFESAPQVYRTIVLEVGSAPAIAFINEASRVLAVSVPARSDLRVGSTWKPLPETVANDAPSRLKSDHVFLRLCHGAEALLATREAQRQNEAQQSPLKTKLKRLERTRKKVEEDLARALTADVFRREGELLTQNLSRLSRGMTSVIVQEFLPDGSTQEVVIQLDPKKGPREEVEFRFRQYRRLRRGVQLASARLESVRAEEEAARSELAAVRAVPAPRYGGIAESQSPSRGGGANAKAAVFREYESHGGQRIWVGKGAQSNDELTFHVARPFHLWLHARGVTGAHVVVPLAKTAAISSEVLIDAAHLALHHSDLKGEPKGEVSYTLVKFVRKSRDAAPGAVTYTREKTVLVRVEKARLARLLAEETGQLPFGPTRPAE